MSHFRPCIQVLALMYYGNPTTTTAIFGVVLVLGGSFAYAIIKRQEAESNKKLKPPADLPLLSEDSAEKDETV